MSNVQAQDAGYRRRVGILVGAVVLIGALVAGVFIWLTSGDENDQPDSDIALTGAEVISAEETAEQFIQDVGTFGYNMEDIDGDNIFRVMYLNQMQDHDALSLFADFRTQVYLDAREQYILEQSPLYYPTARAHEWGHPTETENVFSYEVTNIDATVPDTAQLSTYQGEQRRQIQADVVFNGEQTRINPGSSEGDWDGTHPVLTRSTPGMTATITMLEVDGEWKVYNMRDVSHEYLLATWENAVPGNYNTELIENYENTDTLEPSEPFDFEAYLDGEYWTGDR